MLAIIFWLRLTEFSSDLFLNKGNSSKIKSWMSPGWNNQIFCEFKKKKQNKFMKRQSELQPQEASHTLEMVRAGLHCSLRISKQMLPLLLMFGWKTFVLKETCSINQSIQHGWLAAMLKMTSRYLCNWSNKLLSKYPNITEQVTSIQGSSSYKSHLETSITGNKQ